MTLVNSKQSVDDLYRTHGPSVYRRAREILGSESDAREIVQEVFLSLLKEPIQFGGRSALSTWLYSTVTHQCLNRLRDERNRARLLAEHLDPMQSSVLPARAETVASLRQTLALLPIDLAQLAVHYYLDGMSHEEIAQVIGCSRRHVGNLLVRLHAWARQQEAS